jgi:hypothetical protein
MRDTERLNFIYKTIGIIVFSGSLFLLPVASFAQDQECLDIDPNGGVCPSPLDTWVFVLAIIAVVFAIIHLYRKQKSTSIHQ